MISGEDSPKTVARRIANLQREELSLLMGLFLRRFFVDFKGIDRTITFLAMLFCGLTTVVTTSLYIYEAQYQPIFYLADVLYLFAISGAVHWLRIDSVEYAFFILSLILSLVTFFFGLYFSDWDEPADVYRGQTYPFAYVTQTTMAPDIYDSVYMVRYSALMVATICSGLHVVFEIARIPAERSMQMSGYWCAGFLLVLFLTPRWVLTLINYPRQEKADSVHFMLVSGLILSLQPSLFSLVWVGVGVIFSMLYLVTINNNECFLNMHCYQSHFANDTYIVRTGASSTPHIFAEVSYASLVVNILLVFLGFLLGLLTVIVKGTEWMNYIKTLPVHSKKLGVQSLRDPRVQQ